MGCATALAGSGLGRRVQKRADTRGESLKQAKRAFLRLPSPVLPEQQGVSLSQEIGAPWKFTACAAGSRLPALKYSHLIRRG